VGVPAVLAEDRMKARLAALPWIAIACGSGAPVATTTNDASIVDASAPEIDVDGGAVRAIDLSPLALVPPFSPDVHDYVVRCAAGSNPATLTYTDQAGTHASAVSLVEDQELVVGGYFIRCLPHDFPTIEADTQGAGPSDGWYLVNGSTYAMVLDVRGTPVWYARGDSVMNVDSFAPNAISFSPNASGGFGTSPATRFDVRALATSSDRIVQAVATPTDAHELRVLPNGDVLVLTFPMVTQSTMTIADCEIQEIDSHGALVWSWRASDHIDVAQESLEQSITIVNGVSVVDVFHCNSIDVGASGDLLLSVRHANAVYAIDRASGAVKWKLGGTQTNKDGAPHVDVVADSEGTFSMQHDARFTAAGVSMFDDHGASAGVARGVEYAIDLGAHTATPSFQFLGTAQSGFEGSFRRYTDGHSVIGWGHVKTDPRTFTEVDANGNAVLDVTLGASTSYRAVKVPIAQLDIGLLRSTTAK
jgi:hypothetical protein